MSKASTNDESRPDSQENSPIMLADGGGGPPAPTGVPLSADEAANGAATADGNRVPAGTAPGGGGAGGGGGGTGVTSFIRFDPSTFAECEEVEHNSGAVEAGAPTGVPGTGGGGPGTTQPQVPKEVSGTVQPGETVQFEFAGELTLTDIQPPEGATLLVDGEEVDPATIGSPDTTDPDAVGQPINPNDPDAPTSPQG